MFRGEGLLSRWSYTAISPSVLTEGHGGAPSLPSDTDPSVNALACLVQHLILLLDPDDIVINSHHAYRRSEFTSHSTAAPQPPQTSTVCSSMARRAYARFPYCRWRDAN